MLRFFLEADRAAILAELDHAVALRIAHLITENAGALFERERFAKEIEFPVEDVVAQNQRRAGTTDKICADQKRLRDSFRFRLFRVFESIPKLRAVAQKIAQHRQIFRRGNDQDFAQPSEHERGKRIANHRLVVNRQQLFADDLGQRKEARAGAAREQDRFLVHALCFCPLHCLRSSDHSPPEAIAPAEPESEYHGFEKKMIAELFTQVAIVCASAHAMAQAAFDYLSRKRQL